MRWHHVLLSLFFASGLNLGSLFAQQLPPIKAGLWQTFIKDSRQSTQTRQCLDQVTLRRFLTALQQVPGTSCDNINVVRNSHDSYESSLVCRVLGSKVSNYSLMTGDFEKSFFVTTNSQISPPLLGHANQKATANSNWIGRCPSNMSGGDIILEDGRRLNIISAVRNLPLTILGANANSGFISKMLRDKTSLTLPFY